MQAELGQYYKWIVAFHVISVIAWMAAQLYLPRLFVYHVTAKPGGELSETLKIMERRLLKAIMTPAMISTLFFGILLLWVNPDPLSKGWFHVKLLAIFALLASHGICAKAVRTFAEDKNARSARFYRLMNEVPTVAMIVAIICVIAIRV